MQAKAEIIAKLHREILSLQGIRSGLPGSVIHTGLGPINEAFPNKAFPLGAIHEFISSGMEDAASTSGFMCGIIASLMQHHGIVVWVSAATSLFPPALAHFGIAPDRIIFINLRNEKEVMGCLEEALKCNGLAAVVGEVKDLSFTASRRLQLAVEQSRVTGFIHRQDPKNLQANACVTRWKIRSAPGLITDELPGTGHPCWDVELLKVRNGRTGKWQLAWVNNAFLHPLSLATTHTLQRKTG